MTYAAETACVRVKDRKIVLLENSGQAFEVWREPLTHLRVPLMTHLRPDPYEREQHDSYKYNHWMKSTAYLINAVTDIIVSFLMTIRDYPQGKSPGFREVEFFPKRRGTIVN